MSDTTHLDPFADREADNYDNPIPSREYILEFLTQANVPMNRNDLFEALKLEGEEQYEGLRRRLRAMERDGQLVFTRRQCYALPEKTGNGERLCDWPQRRPRLGSSRRKLKQRRRYFYCPTTRCVR